MFIILGACHALKGFFSSKAYISWIKCINWCHFVACSRTVCIVAFNYFLTFASFLGPPCICMLIDSISMFFSLYSHWQVVLRWQVLYLPCKQGMPVVFSAFWPHVKGVRPTLSSQLSRFCQHQTGKEVISSVVFRKRFSLKDICTLSPPEVQ